MDISRSHRLRRPTQLTPKDRDIAGLTGPSPTHVVGGFIDALGRVVENRAAAKAARKALLKHRS